MCEFFFRQRIIDFNKYTPLSYAKRQAFASIFDETKAGLICLKKFARAVVGDLSAASGVFLLSHFFKFVFSWNVDKI